MKKLNDSTNPERHRNEQDHEKLNYLTDFLPTTLLDILIFNVFTSAAPSYLDVTNITFQYDWYHRTILYSVVSGWLPVRRNNIIIIKYDIIIITGHNTYNYIRITLEWGIKKKYINSNQYKLILLIYCT